MPQLSTFLTSCIKYGIENDRGLKWNNGRRSLVDTSNVLVGTIGGAHCEPEAVSARAIRSSIKRIVGCSGPMMEFSALPAVVEHYLEIKLDDGSGSSFVLDLDLFDEIVPATSTHRLSPFKLEVKLRKKTSYKWNGTCKKTFFFFQIVDCASMYM